MPFKMQSRSLAQSPLPAPNLTQQMSNVIFKLLPLVTSSYGEEEFVSAAMSDSLQPSACNLKSNLRVYPGQARNDRYLRENF